MRLFHKIMLWLIFGMVVVWGCDISFRMKMSDYRVYVFASQGIFNNGIVLPNGNPAPWVYSNLLAPLFKVVALFSPSSWLRLNELTLVILLVGLYEKTKFAWVILLAASQAASILLASGNIGLLLALCCLCPMGAAVCCLFKPYCGIVLLVHITKRAMEIHQRTASS